MQTDFLESPAVANTLQLHWRKRKLSVWVPTRIERATRNMFKMKKALMRCGSGNPAYSPISELSDDVCEASTEIYSAFSKWTLAHLTGCGNYQIHMNRWRTPWDYNFNLRCGPFVGIPVIHGKSLTGNDQKTRK